jgi:hypothetical protein
MQLYGLQCISELSVFAVMYRLSSSLRMFLSTVIGFDFSPLESKWIEVELWYLRISEANQYWTVYMNGVCEHWDCISCNFHYLLNQITPLPLVKNCVTFISFFTKIEFTVEDDFIVVQYLFPNLHFHSEFADFQLSSSSTKKYECKFNIF